MKLVYIVLWLSFICVSSVIPIDGDDIHGLLDLGHIAVYIVETVLWAWFFDFKYRFIAVSIASSPLTELLQLATPWRNPCIIDILNNLVGVALGVTVVLTSWVYRRFKVSL